MRFVTEESKPAHIEQITGTETGRAPQAVDVMKLAGAQ